MWLDTNREVNRRCRLRKFAIVWDALQIAVTPTRGVQSSTIRAWRFISGCEGNHHSPRGSQVLKQCVEQVHYHYLWKLRRALFCTCRALCGVSHLMGRVSCFSFPICSFPFRASQTMGEVSCLHSCG